MNTRWYLDLNSFARRTTWAHEFMHVYALYGGVLLLGLLLVAGWWSARRTGDPRMVALALWAGAGTVIAVGINQPVAHLVAEQRPYYVLRGVEVLVPRAHDFSFPSDHATAAGAAIAGLWLARRWWIAAVATVLGLFLAFARVYVGAHYPGDVAGGLALGALVVLALAPLGVLLLRPVCRALLTSPLRGLVSASRGAHRLGGRAGGRPGGGVSPDASPAAPRQ